MIVMRQTIQPPHFSDAFIQSLLTVLDSRSKTVDRLPVDGYARAAVASAAEHIENWSRSLWWRSADRGGLRSCETIGEVAKMDAPMNGQAEDWAPVPGRDGAAAAVTAVDRWADGGWTPVPFGPGPVGWAPNEQLMAGTVVRIRATATPPAEPPGAVGEALRRLYGFRDQYRPVRGRREEEPIPVGAAMRRSGALECLMGAGYDGGAGYDL